MAGFLKEGQNWIYAGVFISMAAAVVVLAVLLAKQPARGPTIPDFSALVTTKLGKVKGTILPDGTRQFLGVPYGDSERFKPSRPSQPWAPAVKDCTGELPVPICYQPPANHSGNVRTVMQEDCLVLNVFTPESRSADALHGYPVMVWLHGGNFMRGSGVQYNGSSLAGGDTPVVVVSINYRLNAFGFFAHTDIAAEDPSWPSYGGMNGIHDQMVALRWSTSSCMLVSLLVVLDHFILLIGHDPLHLNLQSKSTFMSSGVIMSASLSSVARQALSRSAL